MFIYKDPKIRFFLSEKHYVENKSPYIRVNTASEEPINYEECACGNNISVEGFQQTSMPIVHTAAMPEISMDVEKQ
jgi:hypothetical protein